MFYAESSFSVSSGDNYTTTTLYIHSVLQTIREVNRKQSTMVFRTYANIAEQTTHAKIRKTINNDLYNIREDYRTTDTRTLQYRGESLDSTRLDSTSLTMPADFISHTKYNPLYAVLNAVAVTWQTYIREVISSNTGPDTYHSRSFSGFSQALPANVRRVL
jgi:hypothetical protein